MRDAAAQFFIFIILNRYRLRIQQNISAPDLICKLLFHNISYLQFDIKKKVLKKLLFLYCLERMITVPQVLFFVELAFISMLVFSTENVRFDITVLYIIAIGA